MPWGKPEQGQSETSSGFGWVTFKEKTDSSGATTDVILSHGQSSDVRADHAHAWNQQDVARAGHRNDTTGVLKDAGDASTAPRR